MAHLAGWRPALATLAYRGAADQLAPVLGERVADWQTAWNEPEPARRVALLERCHSDGGRFRDPTAAVDGAGPLADHIGMVQRLAGGTRLELWGAPESCHGVVRSGGRPSVRARPSWPPAPTWPGPTWTGGSAGSPGSGTAPGSPEPPQRP
jgi:hypothetical protein